MVMSPPILLLRVVLLLQGRVFGRNRHGAHKGRGSRRRGRWWGLDSYTDPVSGVAGANEGKGQSNDIALLTEGFVCE